MALRNTKRQLKKAGERARRTENQFGCEKTFQALFRQDAVGVALVDSATGRCLQNNRKFRSITGYSQSELLKTDVPDLTHPDDKETDRANMRKLKRGEIGEYSADRRFLRKNGKFIWVSLTVWPLWKKGEKPGCYINVIRDITRRKRTEEKLGLSEEKYRRLFEGAAEGILILGLDGRINDINPRCLQIIDAKKEEIIGRNFIRLLPAFGVEFRKTAAAFREAVRTRRLITESEWKLTNRRGEEKTIVAHPSFVIDNGRPAGISVIIEDITSRKLAENKLKKWFVYLNNMGEALILITPQGRIAEVNRAFAETWGMRSEEAVGRPLSAIFPAREAARHKELLRRTLLTGRKEKFETTAKTKSGAKVPLSAISKPLRTGGRITGLLCVYRDATQGKRRREEIERALQEMKKFQLAVEKASDMITITDSRGRILFANEAAEKTTGFARAEMIGEKVGGRKLWGGLMDRDYYRSMWRRIRDEKKPFFGELKNRRRNGEEYEAELRISPIADDKGDIIFYVAIERDITAQKEIDRAKSEFVSLASHQLRTPLSSISLSAELLLKGAAGPLTPGQAEYLNDIYEDVFKMSELIESLLNISKIEMGTFVAEPEPVEINDLLEDAAGEIEAQAKVKNIRLLQKVNGPLPTVEMDKNIVLVVIHNLLHNSLKYTPPGGFIELSARRSGGHVEISVRDNGAGIPAGAQAKIFTKFFRADNVREIEASGTGLGLYISKSLLEEIGGRIRFKSAENIGTEFMFTIPVKAKPG